MRANAGYVPAQEGLRLYYRMVGDGPDTVVVPIACWLAADLVTLAQGRTTTAMCFAVQARNV